MSRISKKFLPYAVLVATTVCGTGVVAATQTQDKSVATLSGHVFAPPPPANAPSANDVHIHLTAQDLYTPHPAPASAASGAAALTNVWGAAGAGKAPLAASGPPPVYTTMAAAAAAGVDPFRKPEPASSGEKSARAKQAWLGAHRLAAGLLVLAALAGAGLYFRRRSRELD